MKNSFIMAIYSDLKLNDLYNNSKLNIFFLLSKNMSDIQVFFYKINTNFFL